MSDQEGATGRVSQGVTGAANAGSTTQGASTAGAQIERTTLGDDTGTAGSSGSPGGNNLDLGESASGGFGLHGDREARLRAASDSLTSPSGSVDTTGSARGAPTGLAAARAAGELARGADGEEAGAGLRGTLLSGNQTPPDADDAASPDVQDGTTTAAAAVGGSLIDRVTTGQGGDVGGSVTGPG